MTSVVEQGTNSSQEAASESPNDGQQLTGFDFCQIFIKQEVHEEYAAGEDCSTLKSEPEMWPSMRSTFGQENATDVPELHIDSGNSTSSMAKGATSSNEKLHICEICGHKTCYSSNLTKHMKIHTDKKRFSCELCDIKCHYLSDLRIHHRTHTGEKPFSCKLCARKFSQSSTLSNHLKTHSGEKRFSCEFCDYESSRSTHLNHHLRTHSDGRVFSCEFCDYKCANPIYLRKHQFKIHSKKLEFLKPLI